MRYEDPQIHQQEQALRPDEERNRQPIFYLYLPTTHRSLKPYSSSSVEARLALRHVIREEHARSLIVVSILVLGLNVRRISIFFM